MKDSRQFRATLSELDQMMKWVRGIMAELAPSKKMQKFELAIEEALVNVIHYAYDYPPGLLEIDYCKEGNQLMVSIKDQGFEFNPLENCKPLNKDLPLEERDAGGLGIHFILTMTDEARYQRVNGWNVLTLSQAI